MHRDRLRRSNPVLFQRELYRAIFAGARELGWDGAAVYAFAAAQLERAEPVISLKALSIAELKRLAAAIRERARAVRVEPTRPAA